MICTEKHKTNLTDKEKLEIVKKMHKKQSRLINEVVEYFKSVEACPDDLIQVLTSHWLSYNRNFISMMSGNSGISYEEAMVTFIRILSDDFNEHVRKNPTALHENISNAIN